MRRSLGSTSTRTFVLWPLVLGGWQIVARRRVRRGWLALLPWGYLQYRLAGHYRTRLGGGGPGLSHPPERIVDTGIYALTRNPMYLGHQIFLAGLALALRSLAALAVFAVHVGWFDSRARRDELALAERFGQDYVAYRDRVPRWLPSLARPSLNGSTFIPAPGTVAGEVRRPHQQRT